MSPTSRPRDGSADSTPARLRLAEAFWPGPLTLVVPKTDNCPVADLATAGLDTVAIRIPAHPVAPTILRAFGGAVVAPSANISGHVSPTHGGPCRERPCRADRPDRRRRAGRGRRRIDHRRLLRAPMLLRPGGAVARADRAVLGAPLARPPVEAESDDSQPLAPGMLASHYAPRASVRLNARDVEPGEALLAFGPAACPGVEAAAAVMNLSSAAISMKPPPICSAIFARSMRGARGRSR